MSDIQNIYLEDSFVLDWTNDGSDIVFTMEFSLLPEHPRYAKPKENEWTCYRRGVWAFKSVRNLSGLKKKEEVKRSVDPDGSVDFGTIDEFNDSEGNISLSGDFGTVSFACESWTVKLLQPNTEQDGGINV